MIILFLCWSVADPHAIPKATHSKRLENHLPRRFPGGEIILCFGCVSEWVSRDVDLQSAVRDPPEQVLQGERNVLKAALNGVATKRQIPFQEIADELPSGTRCRSLISDPE